VKDLLWLDLETTGLDPKYDDILMVGVARTDEAGAIVQSKEWVVRSDVLNADMPPEVLRMHTENGLLARVRSTEAIPLFLVEEELLALIAGEKLTLAGNNIGFDRSFLKVQMRVLYRALEYRTGDIRLLDVSMLRRAGRAWGVPERPKAKAHLALEDVKASLAEFPYWKKAFGR